MKKYYYSLLCGATKLLRRQLLLFIVLFVSSQLKAQKIEWKEEGPKPITISSVSTKTDDVSLDDMRHVHVESLFGLNINTMEHGIKGKVLGPGGYIKLTAYLYSQTGVSIPFYQCTSNAQVSSGFVHEAIEYNLAQYLGWHVTGKDAFRINSKWISTDAKTSMLSSLKENFEQYFATSPDPLFSLLKRGSENSIPILIDLVLYKAEAYEVVVPGVGKILPGTLRPPVLGVTATSSPTISNSILSAGIQITKPQIDLSNYPTDYRITFTDVKITYSPIHATSPGTSIGTIGAAEINNAVTYTKSYNAPAGSLAVGDYGLFAEYSATVSFMENGAQVAKSFSNRKQFIDNFSVRGINDLLVYNVETEDYRGLKVFKLSGGMSAEYAVQKSLASLANGISHTWNARIVDGAPDLADGGPLSVYPSDHFLKNSVTKTVDLYNNLFPAEPNKVYETVIIATGVANVPYLASAMKAPVLPLHFLVSVNSVKDVAKVMTGAKNDGYSAFSTVGYDPSMKDIGVAWIKLRTLPDAYKQFLIQHHVSNVIFMGYFEDAIEGENHASRILTVGAQGGETFEAGSIYMMMTGNKKEYTSRIMDYEFNRYDRERLIPDWEGGVADMQINYFSTGIKAIGQNAPAIYTIRSYGSSVMYKWAVNSMLKYLKKLNRQPTNVVLNEYLIGYPDWEFYKGYVPFLYWQGWDMLQLNAFAVDDYVNYQIVKSFPGFDLKSKTLIVNNKANRQPIIDSLARYGYVARQFDWKKADVWLPNQAGAKPRCVEVANEMVNELAAFQQWNSTRLPLTIDDLRDMSVASIAPPNPNYTNHPTPTVTPLKSVADAGLEIKRYDFAADEFWRRKIFPQQIVFHEFNNPNMDLIGYLDGEQSPAKYARKQAITIAEFNIPNTSDEYELKVAYKFNVQKNDGLTSYNPDDGEEQIMNCFEFTSVPRNHWMDIPSRVMAREGATMILNGSVYDFDYNGIPGVVPFIKKDWQIKAQPQILSYKGEAVFAWNWTNKWVDIFPRPIQAVDDVSQITNTVKTLFKTETNDFPNVLGGMTYMGNHQPYDYTALQPRWMKEWGPLPYVYLVENQRCYYAPLSRGCVGTEVVAPIDEGWNNCYSLSQSEHVARFSTVAYRQYPKLFDDVPNARTFVAIGPNNKLHIGIVDGDFGEKGPKGRILTKKWGMHNFEISAFYQYKGYDKLINLDGGSSTQFWLNGRGPLQMMNSYVLTDDNQGPYYSRLVSSFVMLVPKKHTEQISPGISSNNKYAVIDNSRINFEYSDDSDHTKDKAFVCLTPSLQQLNVAGNNNGFLAGNFKIANHTEAKGAVLFYMGEDTYYPDTQGLSRVNPILRNIVVTGVGKIQKVLIDSLKKNNKTYSSEASKSEFEAQLDLNDQSFYYIKLKDGMIKEYFFERDGSRKYFDGFWHSFMIKMKGPENQGGTSYFKFILDDATNESMLSKIEHLPDMPDGFLSLDKVTHVMIGAMNIDGRFMPGNANLHVDNYVIGLGNDANNLVNGSWTDEMYQHLSSQKVLYDNANILTSDQTIYALAFEESAGLHSFAVQNFHAGNPIKLYGLNVNANRVSYVSGIAPRLATPSEQNRPIEEMSPRESTRISLYPNPASDRVTFSLKLDAVEDIAYQIVNTAGVTFCTGAVASYKGQEIVVDDLSGKGIRSGVHYVVMKTATRTYVKKLIIL